MGFLCASEGTLYQDTIKADTTKVDLSGITDLLFPKVRGLEMQIDEGIKDYAQAISDVTAKSEGEQQEAERRIGTTRQEGISALKEQGAQAAYEGRMAMTQAEMVASSEEARLGVSGVRSTGSPLSAAQQNVDLATAAADRTIERGNAGIKFGGLIFGSRMGDIRGAETLLTAGLDRKKNELSRKKKELESNKQKMLDLATVGSVVDFTSSFYGFGKGVGMW